MAVVGDETGGDTSAEDSASTTAAPTSEFTTTSEVAAGAAETDIFSAPV